MFNPFANPANNLPWLPSDSGWAAASASVDGAATGITLTAGTLYLTKVQCRSALQAAGLGYIVSVAGVGASAGCFVGGYSAAGLQIAGSADVGANFVAVGPYFTPAPMAAPVPAGSWFWAAFLCNLATTQVTIRSCAAASAATANWGISNPAQLRCATNGTGLAALPASINPAANVSAANLLLVGAA